MAQVMVSYYFNMYGEFARTNDRFEAARFLRSRSVPFEIAHLLILGKKPR